MTIREKEDSVKDYCLGRMCDDCVLKGVWVNKQSDYYCIDFEDATDEDWEKAYELIHPSGTQADGSCEDCLYECKYEHEEPCKSCKHAIPEADPKYAKAPTYFKPKHDNEADVDWLAELGEPKPTEDVVNHPSHYCQGGMECIDEMILVFGKETVANFCLCNVWKYRKRALLKNGQEDMDKADWYMNKFKELITSE